MKKKTVKKYQSKGQVTSTQPRNAVAEIITAAKGDPKESSTKVSLKQQGRTARAAIRQQRAATRQEAKTERQKAKLERQMSVVKNVFGTQNLGTQKKGGTIKSKSKKK